MDVTDLAELDRVSQEDCTLTRESVSITIDEYRYLVDRRRADILDRMMYGTAGCPYPDEVREERWTRTWAHDPHVCVMFYTANTGRSIVDAQYPKLPSLVFPDRIKGNLLHVHAERTLVRAFWELARSGCVRKTTHGPMGWGLNVPPLPLTYQRLRHIDRQIHEGRRIPMFRNTRETYSFDLLRVPADLQKPLWGGSWLSNANLFTDVYTNDPVNLRLKVALSRAAHPWTFLKVEPSAAAKNRLSVAINR